MPNRWLEWIERLPVATSRPAVGYLAAILAIAVGLFLRHLAAPVLPSGYPFVTFFPGVILTAFLFGTRPGLFAGLLSWLAARYFFIEPIHSLALAPGVIAALVFFWVVVVVDIVIIHFMQRANRLLREERERSVRRQEMRETMFHELQHRVSNKLQIIASLLSLQKRTVVDPDAQRALEDAARRVGMIGRISRALHDPDRQGLGVAAFLEQVGRDIIDASGASSVRLHIDVEPGVEFSDDAGVPIALIVAETISNALEHGFRSQGAGRIEIVVRKNGAGEMLLTVSDDGCGVEPGFDAAQSPSLGLRIATTLARQLHGSYALAPADRGTIARLTARALSVEPVG